MFFSHLDAHLRVFVHGGRVVILRRGTVLTARLVRRPAGTQSRTKCCPFPVAVSAELGATRHRCSSSLQQRAAETFRLLAGHFDFHVRTVLKRRTSEESHTSDTSADTEGTLQRRFSKELQTREELFTPFGVGCQATVNRKESYSATVYTAE